MKRFLKNNINFFTFFAFSVILELSTLFILTRYLFIKQPWMFLTISGIIFCICNLFKSRLIKNGILNICFFMQIILCLFCVILYENTGTLFEFSMFSLAAQTTGLMGSIIVNYSYIIYIILLFIAFLLLTSYLDKFQERYYRCNVSLITSSICLFVFLVSHAAVVISSNNINQKKFINSLYTNSNDKYVNLGGTSNFINEIYKMLFFNKYNELSAEEVEQYIYSDISVPTNYFGVSKGNNLITILVESLEWFAFVNDPSVYPNGANLDNQLLDSIYPNLRNFYNSSVVMNNHYAQNKTDLSENEALIGAYPSNSYINYDCTDNNLSTSLANVIKLYSPNVQTNFFHNNGESFYNRNTNSKNLGYDNLYFIEDMVEDGVTDYMKPDSLTSGKSMNLDSEMIEVMKDKMFPVNERFVTHITSISMHGSYSSYRENMTRWYNKLDELNIQIHDNKLKNYMVSVMEFDYALGLLMEDLESKNLLDNTTIVLFSDHNTYMSNLTNKVKNIQSNDYSNQNYNELFRVPLMIYDSKVEHEIINKFTTTYDIVPTILDLFGTNYYTNLYYGTSVFSEKSTVLYSRAYDVFITDKLYFSNINNILFKENGVDNSYILDVESKCLDLLKKIYHTNHIFYYNYFSNNDNYSTYYNNMASINSQN